MTNRRDFLKRGGLLLGTAAVGRDIFAGHHHAIAKNKTLRVGLIGCGGRGTGAVFQALEADPDVVVTALADIFADNLQNTLTALQTKYGKRVEVSDGTSFLGFDAYERLIQSGLVDVVLLCAPPNFRPAHLALAIREGKHVFCEKPVAVDVPGIHEVEKAIQSAKQQKLCVVSGFCFRYAMPNRAFIARVHNGDLGDIKAVSTFRHGGELTFRDRKPEWSDMEYQLRNWFYYQRYSGDMIVEQTIHSIDYMSWVLADSAMPTAVTATGGRQSRPWNAFGNVFDHFAVEYAYRDGFRAFHFGRQQNGTTPRNTVEVMGTKGHAEVSINAKYRIAGEHPWENNVPLNNMYQTQHDELFAAIREKKSIVDDFMATSTLLAVWGRASAYSGRTISYDEIIHSTETLGPPAEDYHWEMKVDERSIARPGLG